MRNVNLLIDANGDYYYNRMITIAKIKLKKTHKTTLR